MMSKITILLADDDDDDCMFFKDALDELELSVSLITVGNGVELMDYLHDNFLNLPDLIFLDLNMPRKTGVQCLSEIKQHAQLKHLPVAMYSTSLNQDVLDLLFDSGAHFYLRKPPDFGKLKLVLARTIELCEQNRSSPPSKENFIVQQM